jgi:hypothetical protein
MRRFLAAFFVLGCLAGCSSSEVLVAHSIKLVPPPETIPENELLDVAVSVFDPGVPAGEVDKELLEELIREGTFVQIRRTEALYMAVLLRDTLQDSGQWGGVWVTPKEDSTSADVAVNAAIKHSDGDTLQLHVKATDATGTVWLDKDYEMATAAGAFNRQRYPDLDPYQDVFNSIANDLAAVRMQQSGKDTEKIRTVSALRYAAELSPEAFTGYVVEEKGQYELNRLPAEDDPMFDRTQRVRQRERLFIETLDQHYANFYQEATPAYDSWREYAREEAIAIREVTRSARWRTGMGVATILASIVYGSNSSNDSFSDRVIRDAMMYVGMDMLRTSAVRRQEKKLHTDTLEELSTSFDDEVEPMVVEIQGTQHRLEGTAEVQYQEWRGLLREMFIAETGFVPEDMAIYSDPEPELPPELQVPEGLGLGLPAELQVPAGTETEIPAGEALDPAAPGSAEPPAGDEAPTEAASDASASLRAGV